MDASRQQPCASLLIQAGANRSRSRGTCATRRSRMTFDTYADLWRSDLHLIGMTFDKLIEAREMPKALPAAS